MKPRLALAVLLALTSCGSHNSGMVAVSVIGEMPMAADPARGAVPLPVQTLNSALSQGLVAYNAAGEVVPALAESWIVTDDGLSYIFRINRATWSDGREVTAGEVAQALRAALAPSSHHPLKPHFSGVSEIVAMTDRVLEIRLRTPLTIFLQLLAHPDMAILHKTRGTGPFMAYRPYPKSLIIRRKFAKDALKDLTEADLEATDQRLRGEAASSALVRYRFGDVSLVTGGTFDDWPLAQAGNFAATELRRDPVSGLFGLVSSATSPRLAEVQMRKALAMAIDRSRLLARFGMSGWQPSEQLLPNTLGGAEAQDALDWPALDLDARRIKARGTVLAKPVAQRTVTIWLPNGPGGRILFAQLKADWAYIGLTLVRAQTAATADLRVVDQVSPLNAAGWFFSRLACATNIQCSPQADQALADARATLDMNVRGTRLKEAEQYLTRAQIFIPIAQPLRWSLVSPKMAGFRENATGFHTLAALRWAVN
jgi:oligopeptide transport system substrate-binding protein